ncbi:unnamed protein product, partial [marine sediment metagenome]
MPASGTKEKMSQEELQQRQEAPRKHGVYSKTMTPEKARTIATLQDQMSTRPGVLAVQNEQTAKAVQIADAAMAYVIKNYQSGIPLDQIPLVKALPAFMNTAQRALRQLHDLLPDETQVLVEGEILKQIRMD